MKKYFLLYFVLSFLSIAGFAQNKRVKEKIIDAMLQQEQSWNKGDIEGYMAYYRNSDSLKFIGKSGVTYGWKSTLEHYLKAYPDTVKMGKLAFGDIKMYKLNCHLVMVTGSWKLKRVDGDIAGYYSLIWKKIKGKWQIIVDHTS